MSFHIASEVNLCCTSHCILHFHRIRSHVYAYGDFHPIFDSKKEMIWVGGGAGMAPLRAQIMHLTKTLHVTDPVSYTHLLCYSAQAQDAKGGISDAMMQQIKQSYQNTSAAKAIRNAIGSNDTRKLALNQDNMKGCLLYTSFSGSQRCLVNDRKPAVAPLQIPPGIEQAVTRQIVGCLLYTSRCV